MGDTLSDRFSRQRGLIRQNILRDLNVHYDRNSLPETFCDAMDLLGEHLGVKESDGNSEDVFEVIWSEGQGLPNERTTIVVGYGSNGIFLDDSNHGEKVSSIYEPAISTIAACMVWSEILRRSGAYLPIEVPKVSVSVNVRVNENSLYTNASQLKFSIDDHIVHQNIRDTNDSTAHRRVLLRLSDDDPILQQLRDKLRIEGHNEDISSKFPSLRFHLPKIPSSLEGHLTIVGVGGLGTWCLHTLVEGLNQLDSSDVSFLIFDKDMEVEEHNLNRQVIYSHADIGSTKISATRRWLSKRLKNSKIELAYELTDAMAEDEFRESDDGIDLADLYSGESNLDSIDVLSVQDVINRFQQTDMIVGCLDAMRPRVLADYIATKHNIPYVNGGVANFSCEFSEFSSQTLVDKYGNHIAQKTTVSSCQEDGDVPLASMVLTNAFVGAFQALSAIQRLAGNSTSTIKSVFWNAYTNEFALSESDGILDRTSHTDRVRNSLWPNLDLSKMTQKEQQKLR